jgi:hypothetical protein
MIFDAKQNQYCMSLRKLDVGLSCEQAGPPFITCRTVIHEYLTKLHNQHKIRHREDHDRYMGQNRDKDNFVYVASYPLTVTRLELVVRTVRVFWEVMLCHRASGYRRFEGLYKVE